MSRRNNNKKFTKELLSIFIIICIGIIGYFHPIMQEYLDDKVNNEDDTVYASTRNNTELLNLNNIPEYTNEPYVILNNNNPNFDENDFKSKYFEKYSNRFSW